MASSPDPPPTAASITRLSELIAALPARERALAERLYAVEVAEGNLEPPPEMLPWIERTFGSVEAARWQRVVRVTNRWTYEGASFNPLRARRPNAGARGDGSSTSEDDMPPEVRARIAQTQGDDFCDPPHHTPAESIGRVRGRHVVTAANVAKADGWHALLIFDRHDPLAVDGALIADLLAVAEEWAERVRAEDVSARHFFLLWNCLWRAGASLVHGHAQVLLSRAMAQARVELWAAAARRYAAETGGDYFADLVAVARALGLAGTDGDAVWLASLTPAKEREVDILIPAAGDPDELPLRALGAPLAGLLGTMRARLGVLAFNLAVFGPPLGVGQSDGAAWAGFPLVARFVDRGDPLSATSDVAALELFGSSLVASDPFEVARAVAMG